MFVIFYIYHFPFLCNTLNESIVKLTKFILLIHVSTFFYREDSDAKLEVMSEKVKRMKVQYTS